MQLYMFTMPSCSACSTLKKKLITRNISWKEMNVMESDATMKAAQLYNVWVVPTLIGVDENGQQTMRHEGVPTDALLDLIEGELSNDI